MKLTIPSLALALGLAALSSAAPVETSNDIQPRDSKWSAGPFYDVAVEKRDVTLPVDANANQLIGELLKLLGISSSGTTGSGSTVSLGSLGILKRDVTIPAGVDVNQLLGQILKLLGIDSTSTTGTGSTISLGSLGILKREFDMDKRNVTLPVAANANQLIGEILKLLGISSTGTTGKGSTVNLGSLGILKRAVTIPAGVDVNQLLGQILSILGISSTGTSATGQPINISSLGLGLKRDAEGVQA